MYSTCKLLSLAIEWYELPLSNWWWSKFLTLCWILLTAWLYIPWKLVQIILILFPLRLIQDFLICFNEIWVILVSFRYVVTELATDIVVNVGDVKFYLHKVWIWFIFISVAVILLHNLVVEEYYWVKVHTIQCIYCVCLDETQKFQFCGSTCR